VRRILESFLYCPAVRPGPFPHPRRLAYENGSGYIPGPDDAPDAWETLPPVEVAGTLFGSEAVSVTYQLSLAKPVSIHIDRAG
jgi:hypothetical protein